MEHYKFGVGFNNATTLKIDVNLCLRMHSILTNPFCYLDSTHVSSMTRCANNNKVIANSFSTFSYSILCCSYIVYQHKNYGQCSIIDIIYIYIYIYIYIVTSMNVYSCIFKVPSSLSIPIERMFQCLLFVTFNDNSF